MLTTRELLTSLADSLDENLTTHVFDLTNSEERREYLASTDLALVTAAREFLAINPQTPPPGMGDSALVIVEQPAGSQRLTQTLGEGLDEIQNTAEALRADLQKIFQRAITVSASADKEARAARLLAEMLTPIMRDQSRIHQELEHISKLWRAEG